jgi:hypothetical protein
MATAFPLLAAGAFVRTRPTRPSRPAPANPSHSVVISVAQIAGIQVFDVLPSRCLMETGQARHPGLGRRSNWAGVAGHPASVSRSLHPRQTSQSPPTYSLTCWRSFIHTPQAGNKRAPSRWALVWVAVQLILPMTTDILKGSAWKLVCLDTVPHQYSNANATIQDHHWVAGLPPPIAGNRLDSLPGFQRGQLYCPPLSGSPTHCCSLAPESGCGPPVCGATVTEPWWLLQPYVASE